MRCFVAFVVVIVTCLSISPLVSASTIHLPGETTLSGTVLISEAFYEQVKGEDEPVPLEFAAWPGSHGMRDADWFDVRIEAHPGDVIVLSAGTYPIALWVFTPGITITTEEAAEEQAIIHGTVEIDADRVTLDRIAVVGGRMYGLSGHGIEVNREVIDRVAIRNCRVEGNEWMGIHVIGPRGEITELRIEDCQVLNNGSFGIEAQSVENLIITGCTITENSEGVHIGSYVKHVKMHDNNITQNRFANVFVKK